MRKRFLAILLVIVMLVSLGAVGCGSSEGQNGEAVQENADVDGEGKTTITFWTLYVGLSASKLADMVEKFNQSSDEYYVELVTGMKANTVTSKLESSTSEYYPSLFTGTSYALYEYADAKYIYPIQKLLDKDEDKWVSNMTSYAKQAYTNDEGVMVGAPIGVSSRGYFVNMDILKKAGYELEDIDSFDDIVKISKEAVEKGLVEYGYSPSDGADIMDMLLYSDKDIVDNDNGKSGYPTTMLYNEGETKAALKQILSLHADLYKSGAGYENSAGSSGGHKLFTAGKLLFNASTSSHYTDLMTMGFDFEVGFIPFQGIEGSNPYQGQALVEGSGLFICDKGDEKEAQGAYELIKFLLADEQQVEWCMGRTYISPMQSVLENDTYAAWMNETYPALPSIIKRMETKSDELDFPMMSFYTYLIAENKQMLTSIMSDPKADLDGMIQKSSDTLNKALELINMRRGQ